MLFGRDRTIAYSYPRNIGITSSFVDTTDVTRSKVLGDGGCADIELRTRNEDVFDGCKVLDVRCLNYGTLSEFSFGLVSVVEVVESASGRGYRKGDASGAGAVWPAERRKVMMTKTKNVR